MSKLKLIVSLLLLVLLYAIITPIQTHAQTTFDPQYIFLHKNPHDVVHTCCRWYEGIPSSINQAGVDEILNEVGTRGIGNRKLGVAMTFSYLRVAPELVQQSLQNLLNLSVANDLPIMIHLDGFEYWDAHPELWNWWDPTQPGYNPANVDNVEWTGWDASTVIKLSWRNWGVQTREKPHPNLMSPAFIQANEAQLNILVPMIVNWYHSLPANKKYLFGGVTIGWEINIGWNYYFYPNGNNYLNLPTSSDPVFTNTIPFVQLGYAAVKAAGIKSSGSLTVGDLDQVVNNYLSRLTKKTYELGIPRDKIYNHTGSPFTLTQNHQILGLSASSAIIGTSQPGWSFYDNAPDVSQASGLSSALDQINLTQWGAVEWLYMNTDYAGWMSAMNNTLNYRNNKVLDIFNWEQMRQWPNSVTALQQVLSQQPSCWVTAPLLNPVSFDGTTATFSWLPGQNSLAQYLLISSYPDLLPSGIFQTINVHNAPVTGTSMQRVMGPGTYYWTVVNDGCSPVQRRVASATKFILSVASPTATPISSPSPTSFPSASPLYTLNDLKILITRFLSKLDEQYVPVDGKINMLDAGYLVKNVQ